MIPKHPQFCIPKDPPKLAQDSKILSPKSIKKPPRSIHIPSSQENKISKRQAKKQRKRLREQKMLEELSEFANAP